MTKIAWTTVRKGKRKFLLRRRAFSLTSESTRKYIHKSAAYATMISEIGFDIIDAYVQTTSSQVNNLREMCKNGTIDTISISSTVKSMSEEIEKFDKGLIHITHSFIRFLHTDIDKERNTRHFRDRIRVNRTSCHCNAPKEETTRCRIPQIPQMEEHAAIGCDAHD